MAGQVFLIWSVGFCLGSFMASRMLRKHRLSGIFISACLTASLSVYGMSVTTCFAIFAILYGVTGISGGMLFTTSHTCLSDYFPAKRKSALSFADFSFSTGMLSAPLMINWILLHNHSWPCVYLYVTGANITLALLIITARLLPLWPQDSVRAPSQINTAHYLNSQYVQKKPTISLIVFYSTLCFSTGFIEWQQNVWLVTYLLNAGLSHTSANKIISLFSIGMMLRRGMVAIGFLNSFKRKFFLDDLMFITGMVALIFSKDTIFLSTGSCLAGFALGAVLPEVMATVMALIPSQAPVLSAVAIISLTSGGLFSGVYTGVVASYFSYQTAYAGGLFVCMLIIITKRLIFSYARDD